MVTTLRGGLSPSRRERQETLFSDINRIGSIRIGLASPELVREWSYGEVKNPETIDYKTHKPKPDGLFCERIFGPTKDYECACGKYKGIKFKGIVCDRCGVEVIQSKVRRSRLGHIELQMPVAHIWFSKGVPSRMANLLDMSIKALERVIYYEEYILTDPGETGLEPRTVLSEAEYQELRKEAGDGFRAAMGAEAIQEILEGMELEAESERLRKEIRTTRSKQKQKKAIKRLKVVEDFRTSGNNPAWMVLGALPVIPPDLRPLVPLDGGRFATSDLNDLYRRVINRNNRLRRLQEVRAPEVIIRNEKRMLQEAVDALLDNGRRGRPVKGSNNRPLKSLSDMLRGKQGRFRQNLLGKRVDYSGRSVVVVGPELKFHQCGLPKKMALELFEPFIIRHLEELDDVNTIRSAKRKIEREDREVFDVLERVVEDHTVLLNRAPTLHRLGIQAFEPVLVEGKAIKLHPLTCAAFNADFDGDQMAVHVPLSRESQIESRVIMLSSNNILKPADGRPVATPSQDIVMGCYYLTKMKPSPPGVDPPAFGTPEEAMLAYELGRITLHQEIRVRVPEHYLTPGEFEPSKPTGHYQLIRTSVGRVIFNEALPEVLRYANTLQTKKELSATVRRAYNLVGMEECAIFLDRLKDLGFEYAKRSGLSISLFDMVVPETKWDLIQKTSILQNEINKQYSSRAITDIERYNKVIDQWIKTSDKVADLMMDELERDQAGLNPIFIMAHSGARGSKQQIRQLAGMRGLMSRPMKKLTGGIGEIIESPIHTNFKEGLSVLEYFISTHGARKGLADTALKTAEAGYLTRRLVDVAQDIIVTIPDCGTDQGMEVSAIYEGEQIIEPLDERILGRVALEPVYNPLYPNRSLVREGELITEEIASRICDGYRKAMTEKRVQSVTVSVIDSDEARQDITLDAHTGEPELVRQGVLAHGIVDPRALEQRFNLFRERIAGKKCARDVADPYNLLIDAGLEINERFAAEIERCGIEMVKIRSVMSCEAKQGVCARCYGRDLARGTMAELGEAVGVIAAQSIGEPGTQLTLRTFHVGGTTSRILVESEGRVTGLGADEEGTVHYINDRTTVNRQEQRVTLSSDVRPIVVRRYQAKVSALGEKASGTVHFENLHAEKGVITDQGGRIFLTDRRNRQIQEWRDIPKGVKLLVEDGETVEAGTVIARGEPRRQFLAADFDGRVRFEEIEDGVTVRRELDQATGVLRTVVRAQRGKLPRIVLRSRHSNEEKVYELDEGFMLEVRDGDEVFRGNILARTNMIVHEFDPLPAGAVIVKQEGERVKTGDVLAHWDPYFTPIIAEIDGTVRFSEIEEGITLQKKEGEEAGVAQYLIMEHREDRHPAIVVEGEEEPREHALPAGTQVIARDGEKVSAGEILAKIPRQTFQSRDVTGGLPRVEEIFEARKPKPRELAVIAEVDGQVRISRPGEESPEILKLMEQAGVKRRRGRRHIFIVTRKGEKPKCYTIDVGKHILVNDGDFLTHGTKLVDGSVDPHEYLEVMGEKRTQDYLLNEIQEVYRLQGVSINDKHIEVIIRQMLRKVTITDPGDTNLLLEDDVDRFSVQDENNRVIAQGGRPARYKPRLLGITKASLSTESFISAASFQETARVLTQASISGKVDTLAGLKENVIMGHLIPAGTGRNEYRELEYETIGTPIPVPVAPTEEEEEEEQLPAAI